MPGNAVRLLMRGKGPPVVSKKAHADCDAECQYIRDERVQPCRADQQQIEENVGEGGEATHDAELCELRG
jgi:hypothetical protein